MRTFFRCFTAVAALMVVMALPDWGWCQPVVTPSAIPRLTKADSLVAIDLLSRKIAAANPQYADVYKVPDGALIWVPTGQGVMIQYKLEPWGRSDKGCFWDLAAFHLYGQKPKVEPDSPSKDADDPASLTKASAFSLYDALKQRLFGIPLWVFLVFGIAAAVAAECYRRACNEQKLDPAVHPAVVVGGLSDDPQTTLRQVQAATTVRHGTNRNVVSVERGTLRSTNGRKSFVVPMEFGDNVTRNKRISAGDSCWRVRVTDPNARVGTEVADHQLIQTEYWFHHCGNRFGEIKSGQFELPAGWEFVSTGVVAQVPPVVVGQPDQTAEVTEVSRDIEHAAVRIDAARHAQVLANPDGKYTVAITVSSNGDSHPKTTTIEATGHRPIREAKVHKDGTVTVSLSS